MAVQTPHSMMAVMLLFMLMTSHSFMHAIQSPKDYDKLQENINELAAWVTTSLLTFNSVKCKYLLLLRRRNQAEIPQLYLRESPLERAFKYKYLGAIFSADLSWSEHIQSISSKAKRLLGVLYRQSYRYSSSSTLTTLYKSLIRPHLEYASPVWNAYLDKDIKLLESVQKLALKICTGNWSSSYEENLTTVSLTSLAQRRDHLSLCYFYKLVNIFCFPEAPRTINKWNNLPVSVQMSPSFYTFILLNVVLIHFVNILILI